MSEQQSPEEADDRAHGGLEAVLVEHRAVLFNFLVRRMGNPAEAEDVLQDVWIKLREKPPGGPIAEPLAYLFRISENAARDHRRSQGRRHNREGNWAEEQGLGMPDGPMEFSPERHAAAREELRAVEDRLMLLPERTRLIFIAFRIQGCPLKQLSADYGISVSAVQKHLQKAYRAVLEVKDEENYSDPGVESDQP